MKHPNGIEFRVHVNYDNGATISSTIYNSEAKKDLPKSIANAIQINLENFPMANAKISSVKINMRDLE